MGPAKGRQQALADQFKFIGPENIDEAQFLVSKIKKLNNLDEQTPTITQYIFYSHTGKCIRRFADIYAYCRYFIDRKW